MPSDAAFIAAAAGFVAVSLQGCSFTVPTHKLGNWQAAPSYLSAYGYTVPGENDAGKLNSCENPDVPEALRCSGHGKCVEWFDTVSVNANFTAHRLSFCECKWDWADPECRTERKSQLTAFMLSIFLGVFGVDQFYLGFIWPHGILKLLSFGGMGIWWIYDVVRIGSAPVFTAEKFRLAADVHHWAFVIVVVCLMGFIGFAVSIWSINRHRLKKAREIMLLRAQDGNSLIGFGSNSWKSQNQQNASPPQATNFHGYGTTLPMYGSR